MSGESFLPVDQALLNELVSLKISPQSSQVILIADSKHLEEKCTCKVWINMDNLAMDQMRIQFSLLNRQFKMFEKLPLVMKTLLLWLIRIIYWYVDMDTLNFPNDYFTTLKSLMFLLELNHYPWLSKNRWNINFGKKFLILSA